MDTVPEKLAAALAEHYRLERELGAGGMATVYAAEDLKHHRRVAVKVLRPDLAAAVGPERFQDEIEIAARLHHPHIVPVYDSGESAGFLYYVMPLVEGHSLRERLQEGRPIPVNDVARILTEVADALAHAHEHGLVHRDIKPENIMLSGRHVMVMDFGIAKAIRDAGSRRSSTSIGLAMGTPEYMSPEQARGDADLDHRADIYSLGVVGYELLTGRPPFAGGGAESILTRHITMTPAPITDARPEAPPALVSVLQRALAKAPGERWQSAEAMRAQLEPLTNTTSGQVAATRVMGAVKGNTRWYMVGAGATVLAGLVAWFVWGPAPSPDGYRPPNSGTPLPAASAAIPDLATDPSIAVLPFANMSSDKEQEYFSDGISEELLNLLAKVPKLRVIARTSSFQFKDKDVGIREIARQLHVAAVLEGSVRKSGDTVRITAQLVRASDGSHLWSETYDRTLDDVFKVQDEIAANVVDKLKLTLMGAAPTAAPVDPRVYPLLLQAKAVANQNTRTSRLAALALYQRVLDVSPNEAQAHAGTARLYLNQAVQLDRPVDEALADAKRAIDRALAIDPDNIKALTYRARIASDFDGNLAEAARLTERVVRIDPAGGNIAAGQMLMVLGRHEEAATFLRRSAESDPANPVAWANLSIALGLANHCEQSTDANRQALTLSPDYGELHSAIALCLLRAGQNQRALAEARLETYEPSRLSTLAIVHGSLGQAREADAARAQLAKDFPTEGASYLAGAEARNGKTDAAFRHLQQAFVQKDASLPLIADDWTFEPLHKDPRWLPFLRKINRAPEQLAAVKFTPPAV